MALLEIEDLTVAFSTRHGAFQAVSDVSFKIEHNEILAIVGESGSGKSVAMLAVMGLLPWNAKITAKKMRFGEIDLLSIAPQKRRLAMGRDIAMIFQEPMSSLNPCFTVGLQISEVLRVHFGLSQKASHARALELLEWVGIADPKKRMEAFPHQLSGGMCQRIMIAMALAFEPKLLIADEPTTALDVTVQAQILDLLRSIQKNTGMGLILITHDMGVVAETAQKVVVHYAGVQVEENTTRALFSTPHHPYTYHLLQALPERVTNSSAKLPTIPGLVPGQFNRPQGCLFAPRCSFMTSKCVELPPRHDQKTGKALCWFPLIDSHQAQNEVL